MMDDDVERIDFLDDFSPYHKSHFVVKTMRRFRYKRRVDAGIRLGFSAGIAERIRELGIGPYRKRRHA